MKTTIIITVAALGAAFAAAWFVTPGNADTAGDSAAPVLVGTPAAMHFTDDRGNPRQPTAQERAQLAAAFQADLAALTRNKRIPSGSKRESSGAVSAVIAPRKLEYLVVSVDADGNPIFGHSRADDEGNVEHGPVSELPEM